MGKGKKTEGDWTNKGTVPYPILIKDQALSLMSKIYFWNKPTEYPIYVLVSPMRRAIVIDGKHTADKQWEKIKGYIDTERKAMKSEAPTIVTVEAPKKMYAGEKIPVVFSYTSFEKPTFAYEVDGKKTEIKDYNFTIPSLPEGKHTVTISATNKNGTGKKSFEIEIVAKKPVALPFAYNFDDGKMPINWIATRASIGGNGWVPMATSLSESVPAIASAMKSMESSLWTKDGLGDCMISFSMQPTAFAMGLSGYQLVGVDDYLITEPFEIPNDNNKPGLTLNTGGFIFATGGKLDKIQVRVSPTGTRDIDSFTDVVAEIYVNSADIDANWRYSTISLEKYKGKTIAVAFRHYMEPEIEKIPMCGVMIDDVKFIKENYLSVSIPELDGVSLYPTQTSNQTTLTAPVGSTIGIYTVSGEQVNTLTATNESTIINVANYTSGNYFVRVTSPNGNFRVLTLTVK